MAANVLISVDLHESLPSHTKHGLDLTTVSYFHNLHLVVRPETHQKALDFVRNNHHRFSTYCDCSALDQVEDVTALLDSGVSKVFITLRQLEEIAKQQILQGQYAQRLLLSLQHSISEESQASNILERCKDLTGNVPLGSHIDSMQDWKNLDVELRSTKDGPDFKRYVTLDPITKSKYVEALDGGYTAIVKATHLTADNLQYPHLFPAYLLITMVLRSDRSDGLFPTLVTNESSVCLGLVYSDNESIETAIRTGSGVYHSRSRNGLWIKGKESGNTQQLISIVCDCDADALQFKVRQKGEGFCHLKSSTCFGPYNGIARLQQTLQERKLSAPIGSYTSRLFSDSKLLEAKIMEEAAELCEATHAEHVAAEAGDLIYFALTKCIAAGVTVEEIERDLDMKSLKTTRRRGDAKAHWADKGGFQSTEDSRTSANGVKGYGSLEEATSVSKIKDDSTSLPHDKIQMRRYRTVDTDSELITNALQRPSQRSTGNIMNIVKPIVDHVRVDGDAAVLHYTHKFEKATSLTNPVLKAPFPRSLMLLPPETIEAIDISFENIRRFHAAQQDADTLQVETMPGVTCSRFSRPIARVGLYVPGGTAVLPSTALMLGVPAMVAGCKKIILATPPRSDGTITPEIVYVAHRIGAECVVLAGGAQAIAALAYGTESISKVDKILGPGNQFVTAAKMLVSNDTTARVSVDMPAGPSEVLVVADKTSNPAFVASDLLSQAEHGTDSQVVLIAVDLGEHHLTAIEDELQSQANTLPRVDIVRGAIEHSTTLVVEDIAEAMRLSNEYAPEHLILQVENAVDVLSLVENAGSVFVGPWAPESVGDYSAGVNHSLPTYGYAKQYSGVNLSSFTKHITSSQLTKEGLKKISSAVMQLASVEQLEAHRRAVSVRLQQM